MRSIGPRGAAADRGSGTVLVVALCAVLAVGISSTGLLAAAALARHRAQASADLAALAAADVVLGRRPGDACALAARVASANGGLLAGCRVLPDGTVRVSVRVQPRGAGAALGWAQVEARAGPAPGPATGQAEYVLFVCLPPGSSCHVPPDVPVWS